MTKLLARLLSNIVGRAIKLIKEYIVETYLAFIVLILALAVQVGPTLKPELKWTTNVAFGLAVIGSVLMIRTALSRSNEKQKKRIWNLQEDNNNLIR